MIGIRGLGTLASDTGGDLDDHAWFDPVEHFGKRGWKYLSHSTRFLLAAANRALPPEPDRPGPLGIVTATHHSITHLHARLHETVRDHGPGELSPLDLPGFAVNTPATELAIATGAQALSLTLTTDVTGGLEAVLVATAAVRRGRAHTVIAGATEQRGPGCPGEGAAAMLLGPTGPECVGTVLGGLSRFVPDAPAAAAVGARLSELTDEPARLLACGSSTVLQPLVTCLNGHGAVADVPAEPVTEARHGTVSPLLLLNAAMADEGTSIVLAASDHGAVSAVVVRR